MVSSIVEAKFAEFLDNSSTGILSACDKEPPPPLDRPPVAKPLSTWTKAVGAFTPRII